MYMKSARVKSTTQNDAILALENCERRYDELLTAVTDYTYTVTIENGKAVKTIHSSACVGVTGFTSDEYAALPYLWLDMIFVEDRDAVLKQTSDILAGQDTSVIEHRIYHKNGSIRWVQNTIVRRCDAYNKLYAYDGLIRDITSRKTIETEKEDLLLRLKKEKELAQKYLDVAEVMLVALNTSGNITLMNQKGCQILKVIEEEVVGKNWFDNFIPPKDAGAAKTAFNELIRKNCAEKECFENTLLTSAGEERIVSIRHTCLTDNTGNIIGVLFSGADITEQKRLEHEIIKAKKLEATALLAGGIAHDFNNILAVILGNIDLALEEIDRTSLPFKLLQSAYKAAGNAKDLTTKYVTFSAGGTPIKRPGSLEELIRLAQNSVLTDPRIHCRLSSAANLWSIEVDRRQINEAIMNIFTNSKEAMPEGGTIEVALQNVYGNEVSKEIGSAAGPGRYIKISIKDNGSGIEEKNLSKVFDPYFSTKEMGPQKGMGMGLSVAHSIVEKHGGYIRLKSTMHIGTTVDIYLPALN